MYSVVLLLPYMIKHRFLMFLILTLEIIVYQLLGSLKLQHSS